MSEHDVRKLRLMRESLDSFDLEHTDLEAVAGQLFNLRALLENTDPAWDHEFTQAVATLESAALTSSAQRSELGEDFARIVSGAVRQLRQLVDAALTRRSVAAAE